MTMLESTVVVALAVGLGGASAVYAGQEAIYQPGDGVKAPVIERKVKPDYTRAALAAGVEGVMTLECVVRADGTVGEGHVVTSLHPSQPNFALTALRDRYRAACK